MCGLTVPGFILLLGLAIIGVVSIVKYCKNKKKNKDENKDNVKNDEK